ncbi:MAG: cytochrome c-type biogenesis protein CcmH [Methyloprofundus sp.]|nr:cytochrome c-type biogenesis protein CcmH [Methyloprofundus sp.]
MLAFILLLSSFMLSAAIDVYEFKDPEKEKRFQELAYELRCPKCQNQNLTDSNAEIAKDLRTKIQQMLEADKSNPEIIDYMVERYGDFVLYKPRVKPQTYLLWYGPALFIILGLISIAWILRGRAKKQANTTAEATELSATQTQQLDDLLHIKKDKKS